MQWFVLDTLVSPSTGIMFSSVRSSRNLKLVIWYESLHMLLPGDIIYSPNEDIMFNKSSKKIYILNVDSFKPNFWSRLKMHTGCPKNLTDCENISCLNVDSCLFFDCPYDDDFNRITML